MGLPCLAYACILNGVPWIHFYFVCLGPTLRKDIWVRTTFVTVMLIFLKVSFWNILCHIYVPSPFPTITRQIYNSISKDTLQLKILQTWANVRANFFIKTWVNMVKQKLRKVPTNLSFPQKSEFALHLHRTLHQNRWHFTYFCSLFFPLKSN